MIKPSKEIEIKNESSPAQLIREAVTGGADLEKMRGLLELQERWEANEARKAYDRDMAVVQAKIKSVYKSKKNTQTGSKYADLDNVINQTKEVYTELGFSLSF